MCVCMYVCVCIRPQNGLSTAATGLRRFLVVAEHSYDDTNPGIPSYPGSYTLPIGGGAFYKKFFDQIIISNTPVEKQ